MRRALATLFILLWATHAYAQAPANGTLRVTVVDPTSAVIPGAMVTVTGAEDATRNVPVQTVETSGAGIAVVAAAGNNIGGFPVRSVVWPARFHRAFPVCGATFDERGYETRDIP